MNYSGGNLAVELQAEGYDVIILDLPENLLNYSYLLAYNPTTEDWVWVPGDADAGADYIQRSAFVLAELIKRVNANLVAGQQANGGVEQLVVVGPSMGGLIARYALRYIEQHPGDFPEVAGLPATVPIRPAHNTRLYLSFDAPHLGANVPIGDQYFLDYFATEGQQSAAAARDQLRTKASEQMLLHHFWQFSAPVSHTSLRTSFTQELDAMGFPTQTRNVAVTNGSLTGIGQTGVTPCGNAFRITIRTRNTIFRFKQEEVTSKFSPSYGTICPVLEIRKQPPIPAIPLPGSCSLDASPGGIYNTQQQMMDGVGTHIRRWFWRSTATMYNPNHSFIPVTSALAYHATAGATGSAIDHDLCVGGLTEASHLICEQHIPFDAYYGPTGANERHTGLTPANVAFIKSEILITGLAGTPLRQLTPPQLNGMPGLLCNGTTEQVTAVNCHATSYIWTLTNNLQVAGQPVPPATPATYTVVTTSPTITISVSANPNTGGGSISVRAQRPDFADSDPAAVGFRVGSGLLLIDDDSNGQPVCTGESVRFTARTGLGISGPYQWRVDGRIVHSSNNSFFHYRIPPGSATYYDISVQVIEPCSGDPLIETRRFNVQRTGCTLRPATFAVYPNPTATGALTLEADDDDQSEFAATLYDGFGRPCRQTAAKTGRGTISTIDLPSGLYHLTITTPAGARDRRTVEVR